MFRKMCFSVVMGLLLVILVSTNGFSQEKFPSQPVRIVATHAAGGTTDIPIRVFQPFAQKALGVPVVIENMVGGGGNTARAFVYKQKPDGYTLLGSKQPSMSGGEIVQGGKFESLKFVHVFNIAGKNYNALAVPYDSPLNTLDDLKKASSSKPLISSGPGIGTNAYMFAMLLKRYVGIQIEYVPFDNGADAALAVAGGKVQMGTGNLENFWPLHEQKKVRILATAGPERDESHKQFLTVAEQGYPQVALDEMTGLFAPPGLPKDRLDILIKGFQKAAADPDFKAAAAKANVTLQPLAGDDFFKASRAMHDVTKAMEDILKEGVSK